VSITTTTANKCLCDSSSPPTSGAAQHISRQQQAQQQLERSETELALELAPQPELQLPVRRLRAAAADSSSNSNSASSIPPVPAQQQQQQQQTKRQSFSMKNSFRAFSAAAAASPTVSDCGSAAGGSFMLDSPMRLSQQVLLPLLSVHCHYC
jgi:hypothetical protein